MIGAHPAACAAGNAALLRQSKRSLPAGRRLRRPRTKVTHPENVGISSLKLDYGNGQVVTSPVDNSWYCNTAKPRPPAPQWNEISVEMQRALFPAYNGEGDPAEASQSVLEFLESTVE